MLRFRSMKFMKQFLIIAILFLASGSALSQENNQRPLAAYARCAEHIEKDPHKAYEYCSDYLNKELRNNNGILKANTFTFLSSSLKYEASIKKVDAYERAGKSFTNVYVANMTLTWAQVCGGLCGFGFTRNKIVVLSLSGEIVGMFLDDPVNRRSWVS